MLKMDFPQPIVNLKSFRYKQDLVQEQKDIILEVVRAKFHRDISPEVRREIIHSTARDEMEGAYDSDVLMDD